MSLGTVHSVAEACQSMEHIVRAISLKLSISEERSLVLFEELLEWMLVAEDSKNGQPASALLDDAWHIFILHTQDYVDFCSTFLGKYLHHRPSSPSGATGRYSSTIDCSVHSPPPDQAICQTLPR